jgi:hypothetical protein
MGQLFCLEEIKNCNKTQKKVTFDIQEEENEQQKEQDYISLINHDLQLLQENFYINDFNEFSHELNLEPNYLQKNNMQKKRKENIKIKQKKQKELINNNDLINNIDLKKDQIKVYIDCENLSQPEIIVKLLINYLKNNTKKNNRNLHILLYNRWNNEKILNKWNKIFKNINLKSLNFNLESCSLLTSFVNIHDNIEKNLCDFQVCIDIMNEIHNNKQLKKIILCSNDKDFKSIKLCIEKKYKNWEKENKILLMS